MNLRNHPYLWKDRHSSATYQNLFLPFFFPYFFQFAKSSIIIHQFLGQFFTTYPISQPPIVTNKTPKLNIIDSSFTHHFFIIFFSIGGNSFFVMGERGTFSLSDSQKIPDFDPSRSKNFSQRREVSGCSSPPPCVPGSCAARSAARCG